MATRPAAPDFTLTQHAVQRTQGRRISANAIRAALRYGRRTHIRGALCFSLGRNEIQKLMDRGIDLRSYQDLHVLTASDGAIITAYKNEVFRGLRPRGRRPGHRVRRDLR